MKSLMLAVTVLTLASCSTAGRQVQVRNQAIANHSASSPYVIDLTRGGNTCDVAGDIDYSRVRLRTDMPMEDFIRQRGGKAGQRVLLGNFSDLIVLLPPVKHPKFGFAVRTIPND